jgi:hypothetical protein
MLDIELFILRLLEDDLKWFTLGQDDFPCSHDLKGL